MGPAPALKSQNCQLFSEKTKILVSRFYRLYILFFNEVLATTYLNKYVLEYIEHWDGPQVLQYCNTFFDHCNTFFSKVKY